MADSDLLFIDFERIFDFWRFQWQNDFRKTFIIEKNATVGDQEFENLKTQNYEKVAGSVSPIWGILETRVLRIRGLRFHFLYVSHVKSDSDTSPSLFPDTPTTGTYITESRTSESCPHGASAIT